MSRDPGSCRSQRRSSPCRSSSAHGRGARSSPSSSAIVESRSRELAAPSSCSSVDLTHACGDGEHARGATLRPSRRRAPLPARRCAHGRCRPGLDPTRHCARARLSASAARSRVTRSRAVRRARSRAPVRVALRRTRGRAHAPGGTGARAARRRRPARARAPPRTSAAAAAIARSARRRGRPRRAARAACARRARRRRCPPPARARAPSSSGTRASRRDPPAGRGTRSTPPPRGASRAIGAGDLPVGDVANERVREGELALALDRRAPLPAHEALALERVERSRSARASRPSAPAQNTFPTTAASCRSSFSVRRRPSRRAAMMPWSVSGSGSSSVEPRSRYRAPTNCSA